MTEPRPSVRELQALREVGRTAVGRWVALLLVGLFLSTAGVVPILELAGIAASAGPIPSEGIFRRVSVALAEGRPLTANRILLEEAARLESALEERSLLQLVVVPWVQWAETRLLGDGNRQALIGVDGWLFYRPDLEHVTGRPFLHPDVLEARRLEGPSWEEPPHPDPRPAIRSLHRQLETLGIELLVVPTPIKPMIEPERFTRTAPVPETTPYRNPSFHRLVRALESAGISIVDPGPLLVEERAGEDRYLPTDTHWTPRAMERVAEALARKIERRLGPPSEPILYKRRTVMVEGLGDTTRMLGLPPAAGLFPRHRVEVRMVTTPSGDLWRPDRDAAVLLLGDSFTNVFSQGGLGWGRSAGLSEQLSFFLARPVDRIAINAGGAHTTREALARELRNDSSRLDGVDLLVYQFAARELSQGDWRPSDILHHDASTGADPISEPDP